MENLIRFGEKFFDELEIAVYRSRDIEASVELNEISMASTRSGALTIIRGIKDKRLGLAIVDSDEPEKVKEAIEQAAKMAKLNSPDEKWVSLPEPGKYREKPKPNYELKEASPDILVEKLVKGIKLAREKDKNAVVAGGAGGVSWEERHVLNSHGLDVFQEGGAAYMYLEIVGRKGSVVTPGIFDFDARRDLNLDVEGIVERAVQKVQWAYNVVPSKNEEVPLIFGPWAIAGLFSYTLLPAFSGERLVKETTPLAGKVGEKIASEVITLYDDPFHPLSLRPTIADDEGVPTRKNVLIENGAFKGFVWDNYWAKIYGTESTGNGKRDIRSGGINIGFHSVVIENGKRSLEDIIGEIDRGYLVDGLQGAHSSNPDNGNFAVTANPAFLIEDGEVKGSAVFLIAGNVYELLQQASEVSKEQTVMPFMNTMITPHIKFENVKIAGK
ncbi:zinc-dependent protease, TldD/PmbA family [Thermococcus kodakarensis KOD1]|uniref:Zinc-dependent protease, TldD/PmbA family n=1 Tax=Thermococcus kodakarensis (strain ATCC BAA-918 / JCM 12380 / KOD1) TaxID=69014 RepID=Q5JD94_THEKO|nr:TldD/PmbA family protein [Thermococcus kodakarensis]WCN28557.1 TldD/PmbA family protein [Thermococcus kodakarensis]WCN30854.1 TldD/PmbA family protein [Thermococcus kodakarensis]BAD84688.1 zinc-dependent protease, TldD/PmbA family [Thermococcus kodakarensis KOD1]